MPEVFENQSQVATWRLAIGQKFWKELELLLERKAVFLLSVGLILISVASFLVYHHNGLGIAYNDARSHLDIGRRVVEGLKPGMAQLGSVWLPLPHLLMIPTIWSDFMWHSGLAGALESMISFVATGLMIYLFLRELGVGLLPRFVGVGVFVANLNVLYLQSTAMTELLLLATMMAGTYQLLLWYKRGELWHLVHAGFWIMLSTLVRYEGWFLLVLSALFIFLYLLKQRGYSRAEGITVLFGTLAGFGVVLWILWNQLIFKDAFYFIFGPYSAYAQQKDVETAGQLLTKGNWLLSFKFYFYALAYSSGAFTVFLGAAGALVLWLNKGLPGRIRYATLALVPPLLFNVLALYLGHSVLFVQGLSGDTWFNVRYGVMLSPALAVFIGYLIHQARAIRPVLLGSLVFVTFFSFLNADAVTIDDALVGASQKNVSEVSSWLRANTADKEGFIMISAASHDAIIFSSGLSMKKFIHEGTGAYWESATQTPDQWARWIVMRTYSDSDSTWRLVSKTPGFARYRLMSQYPFADVYELKEEYLGELHTKPALSNLK